MGTRTGSRAGDGPEARILTGAIASVMIAMTVIDAMSAGKRRMGSLQVAPSLTLSAATLALGIAATSNRPSY